MVIKYYKKMANQEIITNGDKTIARIGVFNIEVTNKGKKIKVYRRTILGKEFLFEFED